MSRPEGTQTDVIGRIKRDLDALVGTRMRFRANRGRGRVIEKEGILIETHPKLFIVSVREKDERFRRHAYNYADLLTKSVELSHVKNNKSLLPYLDA